MEDIGLLVGEHPFDSSVEEVIYVAYSRGQVEDVTEPYGAGTDILGGTSQLDENNGSWALLAQVMGFDAFDVNGKEVNGFHAGILIEPPSGGRPTIGLQAGDANMDLEFNQFDLVRVQVSAKYLSGEPATWGDGDWNGAPGGSPGDPPVGDGLFNQSDIIAALNAGTYLQGPYAALAALGGSVGDDQTSLVYVAETGELKVDPPIGKDLTSINISSAGGQFIGDQPAVLDGAFDNFAPDNVFKATFGGSFGDIQFRKRTSREYDGRGCSR